MNRFELNVAVGGQGHYCKIELPETNQAEAIVKALVIRKCFGAAFECTLTRWQDVGLDIQLPSWGKP